ncbi:hypothetical protein M413DRAFT_31834 [Hebeloma cylindrosporum]|uniref:Major facilitator superfamily (MFS) profile domain-containing protein n=1 Tax=Hebeloma cylindrosporum TaxID=76867 RepID=A0A0C2XEA5_HEBCY|nr:hypothetical protein M413DRAFT_31834 [Hebeloma cylindrosporum h7]
MSEEKSHSPSLKDNKEKQSSVSSGVGFDFGGESSLPPPPTLTSEQEAKLWRKVDLRLMPILALMYLLSFLDRGNIGNARLQGLQTQLHLTGNKYNIALTMFFIVMLTLSILLPRNNVPVSPTVYSSVLPSRFLAANIRTATNHSPSLVLKRFRPSRWLPGITVAWGIVMTLMGIVKNYPQLVGVRVCLGVAEAGLFPGVVYYLTLWYPRHILQFRIGLFFGAASLAGAFSGLLAYGISFMSGTQGLLGWSWIFILEGIATVAVGIIAFFVLVDFPATATFLTPEERSFIVFKKREEEHFEMRHLWAAVCDWQVWLHILIYMSIIAPLYGITLFLPTIINSFGHSPAISQLLSVPPYVVATILVYVFAYFSDKLKMRSPFIILGLILCLIGLTINISNAPYGVKYFGTFFVVAGSYGAFPGIVAWLGNNLAGQYKRGIGMAIHIGVGNFGGAIAANIYRSQDSPRFLLGHGLELMFVGIGFIAVPVAVLTYLRINKKRDEAQGASMENGEVKKYTDQELREMGDRAPDFRYTI